MKAPLERMDLSTPELEALLERRGKGLRKRITAN